MQKVLCGGIALLACAGLTPATAADLPTKAPPIPYVAPFSWGGFYAGTNAGYGWAQASEGFSDTTSILANVINVGVAALPPTQGGGSGTAKPDGLLGGAQAGYNWQVNRLVYGVEADFQWTTQSRTVSVCDAVGCAPPSVTARTTYQLPWFSTFRARIGMTPSPTTLLYATGGLALGKIDASFAEGVSGGSTETSENTIRGGWTVGGGIEAALTNCWTAKIEYLYMDFGRIGESFSGLTGTSGGTVFGLPAILSSTTSGTIGARFTENVLRAGLNYKF
jgi:outer membrane immunogenic protein